MGGKSRHSGERGHSLASYGRPRLRKRLWHLKLGHGLILVAPALIICAWYSMAAFLAHDRYARAIDVDQPLTVEIFHLHLHDHLSRDLRRLTASRLSAEPNLPSLNLHLSNADLDALGENVPPTEGKASYVEGILERGGEYLDVGVRYRGRRPKHWLYAQKSWKVRVRDGRFLDGLGIFNFINTPDPLPFDELIVMDLAREHGLLTPVYYPFRLLLNNTLMGIHFFSVQPDEGLLRNCRRIPGSLFSGNGAPVDEETGVSTLWLDAGHWKKVAARLGIKGAIKDRSELERLLDMVSGATDVEFALFARDHIDLDHFALFDALDVVFGGNQHDFDQNHKLYFDPYKARFEPIAWNFRGWDHRSVVNRAENPLQIRLKGIPGYLLLRDRIVLGLLDGDCAPESLRNRIQGLLEELASAQRADPYWDAYHLLPRMDRYHRQLVRPMNEHRQALVLEARYARMAKRTAYLRSELTGGDLNLVLRPMPGAKRVTAVDLVVSGHGGVRLAGLSPIWSEACVPARWSLSADTDLDGTPAGDRDLGGGAGAGTEAWLGMELLSGTVLEARPPSPQRGAVRVATQARRFRLFIHGGACTPERVRVRAVDLLTNAPVVREASWDGVVETVLDEVPRCDSAVEPVHADFASAHPWCHPAPAAGLVRLGPGPVDIPETRVFQAGQTVEIRPGTTLRMGPDASLIFHGPLRADGTAEARIHISGNRWGGVVLQGPGTAGSRLAHVTVEGGGTPRWGMGAFPGMLNIHDTREIMIQDLRLAGIRGAEDVLHAAYVEDLLMERVVIEDPPTDGMDLEFCTGQITGIAVFNAGDEALDLMGTKITVTDAVFLGFGGAGISAGEETRLKLNTALISGGPRGVLVKNASRARLRDVLFHDAETALDIRHLSARYSGACRINEKRVRAASCEQSLVTDRPWKPDDAISVGGAPDDSDLEDLRTRLLGMETWDDLEARLESLREEVAP